MMHLKLKFQIMSLLGFTKNNMLKYKNIQKIRDIINESKNLKQSKRELEIQNESLKKEINDLRNRLSNAIANERKCSKSISK